ncbi:unnamed protein product [Prorocentrum cordatum]|uniref:alpha-1,2-Mannosidase n=1 Tax=Prorocentrum cordatum TaxID=2364126 RepID=A0ABN9VDL4_9DINO|nr:unnamed protein product [Polarella glacialis]
MRWSWAQYSNRSLGADNWVPERGEGSDWCNLGLTLVDSLDTLYLMGLRDEFDRAEAWVRDSLSMAGSRDTWQSFFEITILGLRVLGGLLGAFAVSERGVFLERAAELGDRLLAAWGPADGLYPVGEVNVRLGQGRVIRWMGGKGLLPIYYNKHGPQGSDVSLGARGDSYYEYLIKGFLQTRQSERVLFDKWKLAMDEMFKQLTFKSQDGHTYVAKMRASTVVPEFDHLACFVPGMLVLAAEAAPEGALGGDERQHYREAAEEITETCHAMYDTKSGLAPEIVAAEAMYYVHYYTGDPKYRGEAVRILERLPAALREVAREPMLKRVARLAMAHVGEVPALESLAFRMLDWYGYGEISLSVLEKDFQSRRQEVPEDLDQVFEAIDINRDGYVSYLTFLSATLPPAMRKCESLCKVVFGIFDRNKDGAVDADDLTGVFGEEEVCQRIVSEVSYEGTISFQDFKNLLASAV